MLHKLKTLLALAAIILLIHGCGAMDPRRVDIEVTTNMPTAKITSFDKVLSDLGRMSTIYGNGLRIQSEYIADNTGSSIDTKSGIPKDITEMIKSALNAIGGEVVFIPYNPSYLNNAMLTGYSGFENKLLPDVILSGGITEFDQNFETRSQGLDAAVTTQPFNVNESWVPDSTLDAGYNDSTKSELARITLDLNLVDFKTYAGIAKVQTVNTVIVEKVVADKELAFSLFGPTFGLSGSVTKAQGQHAAIRLLVQLSVAQIVGKNLMLPYWKLLPDAAPDQDVVERVKGIHQGLSDSEKIRVAQVSLFFLGHDVELTGKLDMKTVEALKDYEPSFDPALNTIASDLHLTLWDALSDNIPYTLERQVLLSKTLRKKLEAEAATETITEGTAGKGTVQPEQPKLPEPTVSQPEGGGLAETPDSGPSVDEVKKQKELREKALNDAVYRLMKKLSIWDEAQ